MSANIFTAGPTPNTVRAADGKVVPVLEGWVLLPPGDAALTRRVKAAGAHWVVQEKRGRKVFSRGIWTAAATVERIRAELDAERFTESFVKRKEADVRGFINGIHTDEVTGSNPVSPTLPKAFQPKRFTLTPASAGRGSKPNKQ